MTRLTPSKTLPTTPIAPGNIKELDPTREAAKHTSHIRICGYGVSLDGALFVRLRFFHRDKPRTRLLPLAGLTVASKEFDRLNVDGARLISPQARRELIDRLQATPEEGGRFAVATRLGWHRHAFVLPDSVVSANGKKLSVHLDDGGRRERFDRYRTGGTLDGWQEIARPAVNNSRLELLLCLAFVGPVAAFMKMEQPAIMLVGPAEAGKSTALVAAGSVWGRHADPNMANKLGFCLPFNATDNDLEDEALAANHTLLAVDETRAAAGSDERKVAEFLVGLVMRWELGFEKGRQTAGARRSASVPVLLTSNLSLGAMASKAGLEIDDAHHGRLVSVPLPDDAHGAFEDLHGAADVVGFSRRLRRLVAKHFGHPSRDFLRQLVEWRARDEPGLLAWLEKRRTFYLTQAHRIDAPGRRLDRVHEKMATVYATGCLAIEFGILPWTRQRLIQALLSCTRGHVALVAREQADAARRQAAPLDLLRQYVHQNRSGFVDLRRGGIKNTSGHDHRACLGYVHQHEENGLEYLFSDRRFEQVVGGAAAAKRLKADMAGRGWLATAAGTGSDRYSVRRTIGKGAGGKACREQVVAVRAVAFD